MAEKQTTVKLPIRPGGGFGGGMVNSTESAKNFRATLMTILRYMSNFKWIMILSMIFAIFSTIFTIWGPKILSKAITELFDGLICKYKGSGGINFEKIGGILLFLLAVYVMSSIFSFVQGWLMSGITQKVSYRMRSDISKKINRVPMNYFESRSIGEILSRITNDVDTFGQSLNQALTQLIMSFCTILGILIMMFSISVKMTMAALIILAVSSILIEIIVKFSQKFFQAQQDYLGAINGQVEEVIGGHNIVRLFNEEKIEMKTFREKNNILFRSAWKSQFFSGLMMPVMNFVGNLGYVGVTIAGGILAYDGSITVGDIQAFIQYVRNFTQPISQIAQVFNMFQSMVASAERVFEFLDEKEEVEVDNPLELDNVRGDVTFEHVRFGYTEDKIVIKNFTSKVSAGQTVAIVGPTGAGKTTMVKLLMRFYDVNDGCITIDGKNINRVLRSDLRKNIGMVLQDTWLFKGSILENIRYGRMDAIDREVYAAAKAANVHHFIKTLPKGYDMEINEESNNISQGQKQLLTIARAILADKPILILDEATSSVDTRTEELIQKAMNHLMKGRTSFVIAHRLSTIKDADNILVMDQGDIIEQGQHDALLAKNGFYADLYNSQFKGVESGNKVG